MKPCHSDRATGDEESAIRRHGRTDGRVPQVRAVLWR